MFNALLRGLTFTTLAAILVQSSAWGQQPADGAAAQKQVAAQQNFLRLPLAFESQGQDAGQRFVARGPGFSVGINGSSTTIGVLAEKSKSARTISLNFVGARRTQPVPEGQLPGKVNYVLGNDPAKWQVGHSTYEKLLIPGVYRGIDVLYYGNQQQLEFDLVIKPGANPRAIRMKVAGAGKLSIDPSGDLVLGESDNDIRIALPNIYQEVDGARKRIAGRYTLRGRDEVAFNVDSWDHSKALVIDPTIVYSALLGGGLNSQYGYGVKLDSAGNILVAGSTFAADFPLVSAAQSTKKGTSYTGFVAKINPAGTALIYSTYLGGSTYDVIQGLAVDSSGSAWVTGYTESSNFPVLNAAQSTFAGGSYDAFVAKLDSTGVLQFSTYLGGSDQDFGYGIAVDPSGNGYVTGYSANSFPTTAGVLQTTQQGYDAFVAKFGATGTLVYSTLLGGSDSDFGFGIAADAAGNVYVTGESYSAAFTGAPAGGAQTTNNGFSDAFVAKLNPAGTALVYFTFLGGTAVDEGKAVALDGSLNAYIVGYSSSAGLATAGAAQTSPYFTGSLSAYDAFAAKLNAAGTAFNYVTYLGGGRQDYATGVTVDGTGNAYIAGYTDSVNFPGVSAVQPALPGNGTSLFSNTDSSAPWSAADSNIPGAVFDISLNPAGNSGVVLTESGIYRTTNGGASWTLQGQNSGSSGSYLSRSPIAPSTIYAVFCCSSVYQSSDDGVTWNFKGSPPSGQARGILTDPLNAGIVYVWSATTPYVFASTDGGTTWSSAAAGLPGVTVISIVATADGALYAGTNGAGIYKSTTQGASWAAVNTGLPSPAYVNYSHSLSASGNTVYYAWGSVYVTSNGGASWAPAPGSAVAYQVAASAQNASILYAFGSDNTVGKSTDGGSTWRLAGTGLNGPTYSTSSLIVDPSDSAHVLIVSPVNQAAFVAKLNSAGSALSWSTYLGGTGKTYAYAIAVDGAGHAFVTGGASPSTGFPVTSTALPSGTSGAFVTEISDATATCSATLTLAGPTIISQSAQTLTFTVVAPSGCPGASGSSSGTSVFTVQVPYNSSAATQVNTLTVAGQSVTVTQAGNTCSFSLDQSSYSVPAAGGQVSAVLTASSGCPWAVTNNYPGAIAFTTASSGTGGGTIGLTVASNPSFSSRSFRLSVGTTAITINQASGALAVSTTALPAAVIATPYSATLTASGGQSPYSGWTVTSGSLPPGLALNAGTGVISGTPSTFSGSPFSFIVTVQDNTGATSAQVLSIAIGSPVVLPGQSEVLTAPRNTATQSLLFAFATNVSSFDTEFTISNTSLDTQGSTVQAGTCSVNYYGQNAPGSQTSSSIAAGQQLVFTLSHGGGGVAGAPNFQGYVVASCNFPMARGAARFSYEGLISAPVAGQLLTLPRAVPSSQALLIPYVSNQDGFDAGIAISNIGSNSSGFSPTGSSGFCTLNFYGSNASAPVTTPGISPGNTYAFAVSQMAPGFSGYIIANCNFGGAAAFTYPAYELGSSSGFILSETPEALTAPRSSAINPLLFPSVTSQNGSDTGIAIANTSSDPLGSSGLSPQSGNCSLAFYGDNAPASSFTTPSIPSGTAYDVFLSSIAPGFQGYVTAACTFAGAKGVTYTLAATRPDSYTERAEEVNLPRIPGASSLLFASVSNQNADDTNISISNTSLDTFGTTAGSGTCRISYFGAVSGGGAVPSPQTSANIIAGGQLNFSLSQGGGGIAGAPGFRGYIIADCGFPLARGIAEISGNAGGVVVVSNTLPDGSVGTSYSTTLQAANGVIPYQNWLVKSGALPPGLSLNASTGVISGTPTDASGSPFSFTVTVQDSASGTSLPKTFIIAISAPVGNPAITSVFNEASGAAPPLAPGSMASAIGTLLANSTLFSPGAPLVTSLGGTSVTVNGVLAGLSYVSATLVNFQIPYGTPTGLASVVVTNNGAVSNTVQVTIVPTAPGIFRIFNQDLTVNGTSNATRAGSTEYIYFTGAGASTPAVADRFGNPSSPLAVPNAATTVTVNGIAASISSVTMAPQCCQLPNYSYITPGNAGIAVAQITVPAGLGNGTYPVVVTTGGVASASANIVVGSSNLAFAISSDLGTYTTGTDQIPLTATGGNYAYTWSLVSGTLPPGLALRTDVPSFFNSAQQAGLIGVATTSGTYNFRLQVTSNGVPIMQDESIRISALNVKDRAVGLPDAFVGQPFQYTFTAVATAGPVTFTATSTLPPGLTLSSGGVLSGTPTAAANWSVNFSVSDGVDTVSVKQPINVYAVDISTPGALPNATQNGDYSTTFVASGGTGPYTWSFSGNSLPPGLTLSSTGTLSGTVTAGQGVYWFYVQATDANNLSYTKTITLDVIGSPVQLPRITLGYISDPVVGNAYSVQVSTCCGGTAPFTWTATGLPVGMSIRFGEGASSPYIGPGWAEVWGIPQAPGSYNVTVMVTDANGLTSTLTFPLHVSILDVTPGLPNGAVNTPYSSSLRVLGGTGPYIGSIVPDDTCCVNYGLAKGLTFDGAIPQVSGTPLETNSFFPIMLFRDSDGNTLERQETFQIAGTASSTVSINNYYDLGQQGQGNSFSQTLTACCVTSTTWSLAGGSLPPGISLSTGGVLSGTFTTAGDYSFLIQASDANGAASPGLRNFVVHVTTTPVSITTDFRLPDANVGTAYSLNLAATGGTGAITWTRNLGLGTYLPPGIGLTPGGRLSGTPTASGQFYFNAIATDAAGNSTSRGFTLNIYPAGQTAPVSMNFSPGTGLGTYTTGTQGIQLGASGGNGVYTWTLVSGTLPTGLTLRSDVLPSYFASNAQAGLIGVATTAGTYTFTLKVTSNGQSATQTETVKITALNLKDNAIRLPDAFAGNTYSYTFTALGAAGPVTFTSTNTLPPGMSLSSSGVLSGTPVTPGSYSLNFSIYDGVDTIYSVLGFNVYAVDITSPGVLPNATENSAYSYTLTATGGAGGYVWRTNSLPNGLSMTSGGVISGTVTAGPGFWNVTATVTDANNVSYSRNMSLDVIGVPAAQAQVFLSFSGYNPVVGDPFSWGLNVANGGTAPFTFTSTGLPPGMAIRWGAALISPNNSAGQAEVWGIPQAAGDYSVRITATDATGAVASQVFPMHVSVLNYFSATYFPRGTVNVPYSTTLHMEGGTGPYTTVILPDNYLPAGMTFDPVTMTLSGTPLEPGGFNLSFKTTDSLGQTLTRNPYFAIDGNGAANITINNWHILGPYTVGSSPSYTFSACCVSTYTWSIAGGSLPPGQSLSTGGVLSGTVTTAGVYTFLVKAADSTNPSNFGLHQFEETVTPIAITTNGLPDGNVGTGYSQTLTATGGTGNLSWSVPYATNALPAGLTLSSAGVISGTPTVSGQFFPQIFVTDEAGNTNFRSWSLNIYIAGATAPPSMNFGADLGTYTTGIQTVQLQGSGGNGVYAWSLVSGTLPQGMALRTDVPSYFPSNAQAGLLGVATTPGTYSFTLKVTSNGASTTRTETIRITSLNLKDNAITIPDAFAGAAYSYAFTAETTAGNVTFTPTSVLPPGMALSSAGVLSGTPTTAGFYNVNFSIYDGIDTIYRGQGFTVYAVNITGPDALPNATQGAPYNYTLTATGGAGGYVWTASGLPGGLTLSSAGVISGTPTGVGMTNITVTATDSNQVSYTKSVTIDVVGVPVAQGYVSTGFSAYDGVVGVTYSYDVRVYSGGTAPFTWTATGLPPGLSLQSLNPNHPPTCCRFPGQAEIWGIPQVAGDYNIKITATDATGVSTSQVFPFHVSPIGFLNYPPPGTIGVPYSAKFQPMGGTGPYTASLDTDTVLPAGLTFNADTFELSGTPLETGSNFTIKLQVRDSTSHTVSQIMYFSINGDGSTTITVNNTQRLGPYTVGTSPSTGLSACCVPTPYIWSLVSGSLPPGQSLSANGQLSGKLTAAGTYTFLVKATDSANAANFGFRQLVETVTPISITTVSNLPYGNVDTPYSQTLNATGGTGALTWVVSNDFNDQIYLPPGLSLSTDGTISGTPTATGYFPFRVTVTDSEGNAYTLPFNLHIYAAGEKPPLNLPLGNYNTLIGPFALQLAATGGTPPYQYSLSPGATTIPGMRVINGQPLPTNFTTGTGGFVGVLATPAFYTSSIRVTDSLGLTFDRVFTVNVTPINLLSAGSPTKPVVGTPYSFTLTPYGGSGTYIWTGLNMPPGLTVNSSGEIAGTPTAAGTYNITVQLSDAAAPGVVANFGYSIVVSPFAITDSPVLPQPTSGVAYSYQLNASGCGSGCTWSLVNGALPSGLSLSSSGLISGTTSVASYNNTFTLQAAGSNGMTQKLFAMIVPATVISQPFISTLISTSLTVGASIATTVNGNGGIAPYTWSIESGELPPGITLQGPGENFGLSPGFYYLAGRALAAGTYNFTIKLTDSQNNSTTKDFSWIISPMAFSYSNLPASTGGVPNPLIFNTPYSQAMLVYGGTGTYTSYVPAAPVYPGLSVDTATGIVSGTPTNTGSLSTIWTVTDSDDNVLKSSVNINASSNATATVSLNGGSALLTLGTTFGTVLTGSGGTPPYTITAPNGLPEGFTILSGNEISATTPATTWELVFHPVAAGTYTYDLQIQDANGVTGIRTFTATVLGLGTPVTSSLPTASVGVPYSRSLLTFDPGSTVAWSLTPGSALMPGSALPPGLTLSASGLVSGTPTQAGSYSFTADANGTGTFTFFLTVSGLSITTPLTLPTAIAGVTYTTGNPLVTMAATGGSNLKWSATGLPTGLSMSSSGLITGKTTTVPLRAAPLITVSSSGEVSNSQTFVLSVQAVNPTELDYPLVAATLPDAIVGNTYDTSLSPLGGVAPYTIALTQGSSLPAGLQLLSGASLPSTGVPDATNLSGIPTAAGTYTFDLIITDSTNAKVTRTFTLNVTPISIFTTTLGTGVVGNPFAQQLAAFGGTAPYTFSLVPPPVINVYPAESLLPPGITISSSGLVSGTPTATGVFALTIKVQDSAGHTYTTSTTWNVNNANGLRVTSLNFFTVVGNSFGNKLLTSGSSTYTWSVVSGTLPTGVSLSSGGIFSGWLLVAGPYQFTVRATDNADPSNFADRVFYYYITPMRSIHPISSEFGASVLTAGKIGSAYSYTFAVASGVQPYTYVPSAALPPGLSLSSAGVLTGTPTQSGNFAISALVTDAVGAKYPVGGSLVITPADGRPPLLLSSYYAINQASLGVPYATELEIMVSGGVAPFSWSVAEGSTLPSGLIVINGTNGLPGFLSGVPAVPGDNTFSLVATDSAGQSIAVPLKLNVSPLSLTPGTMVPGKSGTGYSTSFSAAGGTAPYTLQMVANQATGLTLANGVFSGTPQYAGVFIIGLTLTDSAGNTLTRYFNWIVDDAAGEAPGINVSPNPINIYYQQGNANPVVPLAIASSSGHPTFNAGVAGIPGAALSVSSGSANVFPNLTINAGALSVGTYSGLLAVQSSQTANIGDVAPITLTVAPAPPCSYSLNPSSNNIPIGGGTGSFSVAAGGNCAWTAAVSDSSLITITSATSGVGPGTITYSVSANPGLNQRNGTISVGGQTYSTAQFGNTCSFGISPANVTAGPHGGTAPIHLTASNSACTWTADGLGVLAGHVSPASGTGSAQVLVTIPANAAANNQSMTATLAGQTLNVTQTGVQCVVTLPGSSATALVTGGPGAIPVSIPEGCTYSTISGPNWVSVTSGGSGTASGTLVYNVDPNSTTANRSGFLTIGGVPFQITQPGIACSITLDTSPLGSPFAVGGGSGTININANGANCTWAASSRNPFVTVSPSAGTGSGSVNVTVTSNSGSISSRIGSVIIAGQPAGFTQGGTICSFTLRTPGASVSSSGGAITVGVIAPAACSWTASPDGSASWLSIASSGGSGTGDVQFSVQPSTSGVPRTGTLTIAGLPFTVTEAPAPCTYTLQSTSASLASGGISQATVSFTTSQDGCTASGAAVTSYANWITTANTSSGSAGQMTYTVGVNPSGTTRKGDVQIGDQLFTITQSGAACAYSLSGYGAAFGQLGGSGSVLGSPSAEGCTPVTGTTDPSIVSLGDLSGPVLNIFTQGYTVNAFDSLTNAIRRATITFGGQIFTIKQSSW